MIFLDVIPSRKQIQCFFREFEKKSHIKHHHIIQNHLFWMILPKLFEYYVLHSNATAFNIFC